MDTSHVFIPAIEIERLDIVRHGRSIWYVREIDRDIIHLKRGSTQKKIPRVGLIKLIGRGDMVANYAALNLNV